MRLKGREVARAALWLALRAGDRVDGEVVDALGALEDLGVRHEQGRQRQP
jgi:hypothetical protein